MWLLLAFMSALLLGFYDASKKVSLQDNAVIPVLLLNTVFCSLLFSVAIGLSATGIWGEGHWLHVNQAGAGWHGLVAMKALLVLASWGMGYMGIKQLPLTIVGPINATRPVMVLVGAVVLFGERLNAWQWLGVVLAIMGFWMLSRSGSREGIRFGHNKWIACIILSALLGALSGLYDKWLLMPHDQGGAELQPMFVQSWYNLYQMGFMLLVFFLARRLGKGSGQRFHWHWSILAISLFLSAADWLYFYALSMPDAMVSIVSMVRRGSVVVSFGLGAVLLREKNLRSKAVDLLLVILSMICLWLGTK
ncbi:MAG: DMT family transporter [Bacteroidaceae bacterium]|nr:DMT family transporter [Bacteroidaceae bacterium]